MMIGQLKEHYKPLYFLAALGNGGLAISFFMYLMFMVKHPATPMATFDAIYPALMAGNALSVVVAISLVGIVFFAWQHYKLLIWNIREYQLFKQTEAYTELRQSQAEASLMAIPLTYAMTMNVSFILAAVFIPNFWSFVEYLFPAAIVAYLAIGTYALRIFLAYFTRLILEGQFDFSKNNNLSQMVIIFAFAMIAVGFAAPGAMSHHHAVNAVAIFFSLFFLTITVGLAMFKLILGFNSIIKHGISLEASPSLWIMIPILTLIGITVTRLVFGFSHHFFEIDMHSFNFALMYFIMSVFISLQLLFGVIGYTVMKKIGYFEQYVDGDQNSAGSFALICPGVAFFVFGMFFLFFGIVKAGLAAQFGIVYFALLVPLVYIQYKTIATMFKLNRKIFYRASDMTAQTA
ncbi:hypothetical protein [Candidatus Albibeggiatoa sp. nov. NOAA]|uniref:TsoY family (seleno)protein n=1 Tax=Candidatus Albibeggiatoa sp. nov. NOAA TaxID=3162724 RepID=UPI0032FF6B2F|nr:hypothetical protein [Thiotrichaceae bacterium]